MPVLKKRTIFHVQIFSIQLMDPSKSTELWALYSICKHILQIIRDLSASLTKIGGLKQWHKLVFLENKKGLHK